MVTDLEELKAQLLTLPEDKRHRLAVALWESLKSEYPAAEEFSPDQLAEFERRSEEVRNGTADLIPYEDVRQRIQALLRRA